MLTDCNKVIFDAQKFMKTILKAFSVGNVEGECYEWKYGDQEGLYY